MKPYLLLMLLLGSFSLSAYSHPPKRMLSDSERVVMCVQLLFEGMRRGDSAWVRQTFHPQVQLYSSFKNKQGLQVLRKGNLEEFLNGVGTPHDKVWDEQLENMTVRIDGGIAQVWTDYYFYLGEEFSHCGVDAFQLVKDKGKWKIIHLLDTRRKSTCNPPDK